MLHETCIPASMRVAAFRHSFAERRARTAEAVFRLVLICTLLGYRMVRPDGTAWPEPRVVLRACRISLPGMRGILLAPAGTAGSDSRTLLHS